MPETTTLEGNKYSGTFEGIINYRSGRYIRTSDHYCDYEVEYAYNWWEIDAAIKTKKKRYIFKFRTEDFTPEEFSRQNLYD